MNVLVEAMPASAERLLQEVVGRLQRARRQPRPLLLRRLVGEHLVDVALGDTPSTCCVTPCGMRPDQPRVEIGVAPTSWLRRLIRKSKSLVTPDRSSGRFDRSSTSVFGGNRCAPLRFAP